MSQSFVRFVAGREIYALPLLEVREVATPGRFSRIPTAPGCALGVMNHHGRVVTVVDLEALMSGSMARPPALCLLLDDGHRRIGLGVGAVEGIGPLQVDGEVARLGDLAVSVLSRDGVFRQVDLAFGRDPVLESAPHPREEA